jgi:hypothetical protein
VMLAKIPIAIDDATVGGPLTMISSSTDMTWKLNLQGCRVLK